VPVGESIVEPLELASTSSASVELELSTAPPFSIPSAHLKLAGASASNLSVTFAPGPEGSLEGRLSVHLVGGATTEIPLTGRGLPACPAARGDSGPCVVLGAHGRPPYPVERLGRRPSPRSSTE
jgi:hypothetical protein